MKIAYLDCFAGISGDMMLGALVDAGLDLKTLEKELSKLNISGYRLSARKAEKHGIRGTKVDVIPDDSGDEKEHKHHNSAAAQKRHAHRHLKDIKDIISSSTLEPGVKEKSIRVFERIAEAEAKVHGCSPDEIHFHEVGAVDAIVDIVGSVVGLKMLGIENVFSSGLRLGKGFVHCAHGTIPLPAPATLEIIRLAGKGARSALADIEGETVTPTGAAIATVLAKYSEDVPDMEIESIGYGAGNSDFDIPNMLRIVVGRLDNIKKSRPLSGAIGKEMYEHDTADMTETNIDDMNPELHGHVMQRLLDNGALDVFISGVLMKKSRHGTMLSVLSRKEDTEKLCRIIFEETTTFGVRTFTVDRRKLASERIVVNTEFGDAHVKLGKLLGSNGKPGRAITASPEYDDCKKLAGKSGVPLMDVYAAVMRAYEGLKKGIN